MSRPAPETFDSVEPMLAELRRYPQLTEKSRGVFYIKSKAFLHFHGKPGDVVADVKTAGDWTRLPVNTDKERNRALDMVEAHLNPPKETN